jgi:hypothetical protein
MSGYTRTAEPGRVKACAAVPIGRTSNSRANLAG